MERSSAEQARSVKGFMMKSVFQECKFGADRIIREGVEIGVAFDGAGAACCGDGRGRIGTVAEQAGVEGARRDDSEAAGFLGD